MNLLLIIPFHDDLGFLPYEAETLVNLLQPRRILQGEVTEERLRATIQSDIREGGFFDGIWLATHSNERAIELSDGSIDRDALVQYVAQSGASWIVLNGCESEGLAAGIAAIGVDVVAVAMTPDSSGIEDKDASRFAAALAYALEATGGNLEEAFSSIPHGSAKHRFFPAGQSSRAYSDGDRAIYGVISDLSNKVARMDGRLEGIERSLDELRERSNPPTTSPIVAAIVVASALISAAIIGGLFILNGLLM